MLELEYFEQDGREYVRVEGTMMRTHHIRDQEALNRALVPLELTILRDPYPQVFEASGYRIAAQLPGPVRAVLADEGPPYQCWHWQKYEFVWIAFDIEAELPHIFYPSTGKDARLVTIDSHPFQVTFAADEGTQRYVARFFGYLHDKLAIDVYLMAPSPERRDELIAGIASMRVLKLPGSGA